MKRANSTRVNRDRLGQALKRLDSLELLISEIQGHIGLNQSNIESLDRALRGGRQRFREDLSRLQEHVNGLCRNRDSVQRLQQRIDVLCGLAETLRQMLREAVQEFQKTSDED